ncbi:MAG: hypothetical protein IJI50_03405 [Ruminococcus sp.]|nr:hypothetical protein [Ruminococcus sp.]
MEYFMYLVTAAAIVFPWYLISTTIDRSPKRQEKALRKAIEQGHVVTAVFVRSYQKEKGNGRQCDYKYEVNGKTYTCSVFSDNPPRTMKFYYVRNPKNANIATAINVSEKNWILRFVIIAAIIIIIAKVFV